MKTLLIVLQNDCPSVHEAISLVHGRFDNGANPVLALQAQPCIRGDQVNMTAILLYSYWPERTS
jgi:hypothetical protein